MPRSEQFHRALEIEAEMKNVMRLISVTRDDEVRMRLNRQLDELTEELATLQATTLAA